MALAAISQFIRARLRPHVMSAVKSGRFSLPTTPRRGNALGEAGGRIRFQRVRSGSASAGAIPRANKREVVLLKDFR